MIGQIDAVNRSKSGKSLGVQVGGIWYTTKDFSLEQAVGRTIIFEPTTSPASGNFPAMNWLNDYQFDDAGNTPATQAFNQAHSATGSGVNKDAMIGAMALVKATPGDAPHVWANFEYFYDKLDNWTPGADEDIPGF